MITLKFDLRLYIEITESESMLYRRQLGPRDNDLPKTSELFMCQNQNVSSL